MTKNITKLLILACSGLLSAVSARAQSLVTERDVTKPCMIMPHKACSGAKTGAVLQIWPGEDVYVSLKDGKYLAEFYALRRVFEPSMRRGGASYDSLASLNEALAAKGFNAVEEHDLTGPCMINGRKCRAAAAGKVMQFPGKSEKSRDVHVLKEDGLYLARYYAYARVFEKKYQRNTESFPTLGELNAHLAGAGFDAVTEKDITGPCVINGRKRGAVTGKVMQDIKEGKDIHVMKQGGKYVATKYPLGHAFRGTGEAKTFDTLDELDRYLAGEFNSTQ